MRVEEVKTVLGSMGKRANKRLGQNFLLDESVVKRQVSLASLGPGDTVLEVGPGLGVLTEEILSTGAKVVAVEQDEAFCGFLERRFGKRITLVHADAVKAFLPSFDKVVSNLPYQISSPIVFKLLEAGFDVAVLMLQREFAERMVAAPGSAEYGRLSVGVYYRADCEIAFNVSRSSFWPQPKVDSCVVTLVPKEPPFRPRDERLYFDVVRAIFSHRRKKVSNSLNVDPAVSWVMTEDVRARLNSLPHASKRAEELSPEMICELADALLEVTASCASRGRTGR